MSDEEKQCVLVLLKLYRQGRTKLESPRETLAAEGLTLSDSAWSALWARMSYLDAVQLPPGPLGPTLGCWFITPKVVDMAAEQEKLDEESRDLVTRYYKKARRNDFVAGGEG